MAEDSEVEEVVVKVEAEAKEELAEEGCGCTNKQQRKKQAKGR